MKNAEIIEFAKTVYDDGCWGGAIAHARFTRKLPLAETAKIKDAFRPKIEEELAKLKAMNKNDLNRNYCMSFVRANIMLDGEEKSHEFVIHKCCKSRPTANSRRIYDVMSINDIFKLPITGVWYPNCGDWHDHSSYNALIPNDDGTYTRVLNEVIEQKPIPQECRRSRSSWTRRMCKANKASFVKLVKEYVATKKNEGWTLTATSSKTPWGTNENILVFEKAAVDSIETKDTIQPNESPNLQPICFDGISITPMQKDIDRISKIINECGDDHAKAISKATLMNSKITDIDKRRRRHAACLALKADWLANCFG